MVGDRYETPPPGGLLYYLKGNHMQGLPTLPHEKRGVTLFGSTSHDILRWVFLLNIGRAQVC